ncbi:glycosyltransferase [Paractinoplanes rishiriensis]|uniref:Glycosyl transferase family 1 n=1 Tax=Paractinoplanes rishiriensis TaxID=1050105 RepID=A0A919K8H5_9ACTN|nr:glycosyltransferase [Actinoplanes rishiriensis]GIF00693.1 glycosyl transferase family 1 [Actinoplanes rishiriensis]
MPADPRVVIWRSALLGGSETFVRNHGDALTRWQPVYVGATRTASPLSRAADLVAFPSPRSFLRLRLTGSSPRLGRLLGTTGARLVHAHFGGDGWLVSREAARLGLPLVVTVHGHDVTRQPASPGLHGLRYRHHLRTVFRRAAVIIAVSEVIRDRAVACGADPAKVRVHYTGVPVPAEVPDRRKEWDVAFVGRFVEKKGVDDLLAALAALGPTRPRTVLLGAGPMLSTMRAYAAALGVDATFLGAQPPEQVTRVLTASRLLAAPSRTARDGDTEGLPTTVLEAAALGLPVVATTHSGIPEAVTDGETGLLGPEGDRAALAANLSRLLADDVLRKRLGSQARTRVAERFNLTVQSRQLEALYDELTPDSQNRP